MVKSTQVVPVNVDVTEPFAVKSNEPNLLNPTRLRQIADESFVLFDKGIQLQGKATQRLAYAVLAYWAWMRNDGQEIGDLASIIPIGNRPASKDAKDTISAKMVAQFIGEAFDFRKEHSDWSSERIADYHMKRTAHTTMLRNAMILAAVLASRNVGVDQYDEHAQCFVVPADMLLGKGMFPTGWLNSGGPNNSKIATLPLSNKAISADGKKDDKIRTYKLRASAKQLMSAYQSYLPPKPTPTVPPSVTVHEGLATMIANLHGVLCSKDAPGPETVQRNDWADKTLNQLGELMSWYDKVDKRFAAERRAEHGPLVSGKAAQESAAA